MTDIDRLMTTNSFPIASGMAAIVTVSVSLIILVTILSLRAERRRAHRLSYLVDKMLTLPKEQVHVFMRESRFSYDLGEYSEYSLCAMLSSKESIVVTKDDYAIKSICNKLAEAGRPVSDDTDYFQLKA